MNQLPNLLSLSRLLASPLLIWLVLQHRYRVALGAVVLAGITDWLDGAIARAAQARSPLGAYLDPLADKAMLVTLFLSLGATRNLPPWEVWLVMGRDAIILFGSAALRAVYGYKRFVPTVWGKISTFFQIVTVVVVLCAAAFDHPMLDLMKTGGIWATALCTTVSGLQYVARGISMMRRARQSLAAGASPRV